MNKEAITSVSFIAVFLIGLFGFMFWHANQVSQLEETTEVRCGINDCYLQAH